METTSSQSSPQCFFRYQDFSNAGAIAKYIYDTNERNFSRTFEKIKSLNENQQDLKKMIRSNTSEIIELQSRLAQIETDHRFVIQGFKHQVNQTSEIQSLQTQLKLIQQFLALAVVSCLASKIFKISLDKVCIQTSIYFIIFKVIFFLKEAVESMAPVQLDDE